MTSKAYVLTETSIKVNGEVSADIALSAENLADSAGRVSAQKDWGTGARAFEYDYSIEALWQATPTQYKALEFYLATAPDNDSSQIDGDVGAVDAALGDVDQLLNMEHIDDVVVEDAATTKMVASGSFTSSKRYHTYVIYNDGGAALNATDTTFILTITPKAVQGQTT